METIMEYFDFVQFRSSDIFSALWEHIMISGLSVLFGCLLAIPLGTYLTKVRDNPIKTSIFMFANVFQTIPSLALFAILIPILGIGMKPAIFALFLYSLLPLLRNTYAGFKSVDAEVIESARGMGYSTLQRLLYVELPLAFPYIMSGIRITTVYIISWTTLATLIGAGGLGILIFSGLSVNNDFLVFTGAIVAIILAIVTDLILGTLEKKVSYQNKVEKRKNNHQVEGNVT